MRPAPPRPPGAGRRARSVAAMTAADPGDRTRHFAAIERKHGLPASHWLDLLAELGEAKYPEQMALLQKGHGFSRTHANALVMYHRGSPTSRRFATHDDWLAQQSPEAAATASAVFAAIQGRVQGLEPVIAWNQPMLRRGTQYVFGLSAAKRHLTLAAMATGAIEALGPRLDGLGTNKKTITVPHDWDVDAGLLVELVRLRLAELPAG